MQRSRYGSSAAGPTMPVSFASSLPLHASPPSIPSSSYPYAPHPTLPTRMHRTMKRSSSSTVPRPSRSQAVDMAEEQQHPQQQLYNGYPSQPPHPQSTHYAPQAAYHNSQSSHQPTHPPPQSYSSPQHTHPPPHSHPPQPAASQHSFNTAASSQQQQPPPNTAYVINLQQQIYFLELELQLLKQTNPSIAASNSTDPDAPIDSLVTSLREKYIQQTAQLDALRSELQNKLDTATQQLQLSEKEKERITVELDALKERTKEWKDTAREKRADSMLWEKRAKDVEAEAAEKQAAQAQRIEKLEAQVRQQCVERAMTEDKRNEQSKETDTAISALKDEVHKLRDRNHSLQQREVELQHKLDVQPHHALREELDRVKAAQRDREKHWREMQLKLEERDEQVSLLERQRDELSEENFELRKKLEAEEQERRAREDEDALHAGGRQKWSEELVKGRHAHATIADEVAACKDRIERLRQQLREEKEEKLGLLHTVKEWEQRIAHQQHEDDKHATERQQQKQQLDQLSIDFQLLREEHNGTQQRLAATEADKAAAERRLDERDIELQRLRKQSDLLRLMEGVNVHEMTAAASSHQRMADVIGRLVGQMASREVEDDKREAGRYRVDEMNSGGLDSARSEVVVQVGRGKGRERDEEKMRDDVESDDGSVVDSPRSVSSSSSSSSASSASSYSSYSSSALSSARSSLPSRPSTGSSLSRPLSAVSSASLSSAVSGVSNQPVRQSGRSSGGKSGSSKGGVVDRQRMIVRPNRASAGSGRDALLYS